MKQSIYIETTIISYLTARPSSDVIRYAHQLITQEWWDTQRNHFDLFTSELVIVEASAGDPVAAQRRLSVLHDLPVLPASDQCADLATALLQATALPPKSSRDALHVAIAALAGVDYLLTWNCTHLANGLLQHKIARCCVEHGVRPPIITTPDHLFDEAYHARRDREPD